MAPWRIVFMGTPDFAVPSLETLLTGPHDVVGIFTQPDRPRGRGMKPTPPPIKQTLLDRDALHTIPLFQPESLRGEPENIAHLKRLQPDLIIVVAYGHILSPEILALPRQGCLNIHASLLPRWRGAAPIQRAILAGDTVTGVTLMQMEAGLDTGPILHQISLPIPPEMTGGNLHDQLARLGAHGLHDALPLLQAGTLTPQPQPKEGVTYAAKLTRQDEQIDWNRPATTLQRHILALDPWPAAHTRLHGKPLKIFGCQTENGSGSPGQVIACRTEGPEVACASGSLILTEVQPAGKRRMPAADWLRGHSLPVGVRLGA